MKFNEIVKELREKGSLTQEEFAQELHVSKMAVWSYENSRLLTPSLAVAKRLVKMAKMMNEELTLDDIYN